MGKTLRTAIQHRNIIEASIESGVISGDVADCWKSRKEEYKQKVNLIKKAEGGDIKAMEKVASNYHDGKNGFLEDEEAAFVWYEKAQNKGSVIAMAEMGDMLVVGDGIEQQRSKGLVYLGMAAAKGSDLALCALGEYFADGDHGLPVDKVKAIEFLTSSVSGECPHLCMNDKARRRARKKLDKLQNGSAEVDSDSDDDFDDFEPPSDDDLY